MQNQLLSPLPRLAFLCAFNIIFMMILDKIEELKEKREEIINKLQDPEIINDREKLINLSREKKNLDNVIEPYNRYQNLLQKMEEDKKIIKNSDDRELIELAREELDNLKERKESILKEIREAMIPEDPDAEKNVVLEIRAGTGGEEAALFSADILRMYQRYSERKNWKFEIVDYNRTDMNGYKEVIAMISGDRVYSFLKFEGGVHRVQRVPKTESGGRIHTSAVTVAVLPEREEFEMSIDPSELNIDFYSASGPGGQHVNRASTAVRIEHEPTGLIVTCQDERSQHQNRIKAMKLLRSRLYEMEKEKREQKRKNRRKNIVGTGDRSEKIRTYNFPQNRITDHRINYTEYNLEAILDGEMDKLISSLREFEREKLIDEIS